MTPIPELPIELLNAARIVPNRLHILDRMPPGGTYVEIGVALGDFSQQIITRCRPDRFIAIDLFDLHTLPALWGRPTAELFGGKTHGDYYRHRFAGEIAAGWFEVMEGDSAAMMEQLDDRSLQVVYVDADHRYEGVKRDIEVVGRKINDNGIIIMNDYTFLENVGSKAEYGVIHATHEFMMAEKWEMILLALERYMFCDVALRKCRP